MCPGIKFGLIQTKAGVVTLIKNFLISVSHKCVEPIELCPKSFMYFPKNPILLNFKPRN